VDTAADLDRSVAPLRRARALRRIVLAAMLAFIGLGVVGVFDPRDASVRAGAGSYKMRVSYPKVARAGLGAELAFQVQRRGGFGQPVSLATGTEYLDLFEQKGLEPQPIKSTADASRTIWTFDPPPGDVLSVRADLSLRPAVRTGRAGRTELLVGNRLLVDASYRTRVVP
jgi:hypothetical protein